MKKWKKAALALTAAMMFTTVVGVTACKKKPADKGDPTVTLRDDTRPDAYVAYKPDGSELGKYKTLAAAINAAVEFDAEEEVYGSTVRKVGGKHDLFKNRNGYEDTGDGNDDTFWFYDEGTKLDMVDCWQNDQVAAALQNSDYVVTKISHFGADAVQSWNGYQILNVDGDPMDTDEMVAQSWELSSTMDASMMAFPDRLNGVTKQTYEIDLSDVRITPPYKGADTTYAFMGFYNWQDFYVIDIGIACDTATGVWYPFIATSRDDSFSDAEYKFQDKTIMKSTWNAQGGYFKPDITGLTMEIETQLLEDGGDTYQSNYFTITNKATGEKLYEFRIEDETTQEYFSTGIGKENTYVFNAGLDVKSELGFDSVKVKPVDYFNGAAFENLKITSAEWYFATEEEISQEAYGYDIDADLRGKTFNLVLADANKDIPKGVYDYVLLNNSYFVDYSSINGADVYSFSFNKPATSDEEFGTTLGGYQNAIDELIGVTEETVADFDAKITEMQKWDAVSIPAKYYQLLDFSPLTAAAELLQKVKAISEDAAAFRDAFNALENIDAYNIQGWEAPNGTAIKGYIWSEIQKFNELKEDYEDLSSEDQANLKYHINMTKYATWVQLAEEMTAAVEALEADSAKIKLGEALGTAPASYKEYNAVTALSELVYWANAIKVWDEWPDGVSPDGTKVYDGAVMREMDTNACYYASLKIVLCYNFLNEHLKAADVDMPEWIEDILDDIEYDEFYEGVYYPLYGTTLAALKIKNNAWQNDTDLAKFLNDVWGPDYTISGHLNWNWVSGNRFKMYMTSRTSYLIKLVVEQNDYSNAAFAPNADGAYIMFDYFKAVGDFLHDTYEYEIKDTDWGIKAGQPTIDLTVNVSAEAQAVVNQINALSMLDGTYRVIEWTAPEGAESIKGYYYSEVLAARTAKTAYDALNTTDQVAVRASVNAVNWTAWQNEIAALATIEALGDDLTAANFKIDNKRAVTTGEGDEAVTEWVKNDEIEIRTAEEVGKTDGATYYETVYVKTYPAQCSMENGVYAMRQMLMHASFINTTVDGMKDTSGAILNSMIANSGNQNRNIRITLCYEYLVDTLEVELTPFMQQTLSSIKFNEWYSFYKPVEALMEVAKNISELPAGSTLADVDAADLAVLNTYYVNTYQPSDFLKEVWGEATGKYKWRLPVWIKGIETVKFGSETPAGSIDVYFKNGIDAFLIANGYGMSGTGWGTSSTTILPKQIDAAVTAAVGEFSSAGNPLSDEYTIKGWEAPTGTVITGYLYSEYLAYVHFKDAYEALTDAQKSDADDLVDATVLAAWTTFAPEMKALVEADGWATFTFSSVTPANIKTNWTGGLAANSVVTADKANGTAIYEMVTILKAIQNHANFMNPLYMANPGDCVGAYTMDFLWIYNQVEAAGLADKLPSIVTTNLNTVKGGFSNFDKFAADFKMLCGAADLANKIASKDATVADIVTYVNTYLVGKTTWGDGGWNYNYNNSANGDISSVYVVFYGYSATDLNVVTPFKTILATIPAVETVAWGKAGCEAIGVKAAITAADVTAYTTDPGYTTTQSGTLLPQFNKDWTVDEKGASVTTVSSDSEGYKFTATEAVSGAYYIKAAVNKTFPIKGSAVYAKLGMTEKYDFLVWYKIDGQGKTETDDYYVYLSDIIEGAGAHNNACLTYELDGSFVLSDMFTTGTNITITAIGARMFSAGTFTISAFYVENMPGYKAPQEGNILPEYEAGWKVREADSTAKVTATTDGYKFTPATGGWTFFDAAVGMNNVTVEGNSLFIDMTVNSVEKNGDNCLDVIVYFGDVTNKYFACVGGVVGTKYQLVGAAGTYHFEVPFTGLRKNAADNKELDGTLTQLDVKAVAVYAYGGTDVTISAMYVGKSVPAGYSDGQNNSLLPAETTGWAVREADSTAKVVATEDGYKFTTVAGGWTFYDSMTGLNNVTVEGNSLYIEMTVNELVKDGSNGLDIIVYFDDARNTKFACVGGVVATKYQLVAATGTYSFEVPFTGLRKNAADNKGLDGTLAQLDVKGVAVYAYGGTDVTISALYVTATSAEMLYGSSGTSALAGITAGMFKTSYASDETRTYALNQETADIEVKNGVVTVMETKEDDSVYSYSLPTGIKIKRNTVLYYDLEGEGEGVDLVIWLSKENHYFNLCEVIKWKATGEARIANELKGEMKGYVTGEDIINYLVVRGRSGWGFTAEAAPNIAEIGIYEIVVYLKDAILTINDLRVVGEFSTEVAMNSTFDATKEWTAGWIDSPVQLRQGEKLTYTGTVTSNMDTHSKDAGHENEIVNYTSVMFEVRTTAGQYNCIDYRMDDYGWTFVDAGKTQYHTWAREASKLAIKDASGAAVTFDWATFREMAKDADWTVSISWTGNTITVDITLVAKSGDYAGYTYTCGSTVTIAAGSLSTAYNIALSADTVTGMHVDKVVTTYIENN